MRAYLSTLRKVTGSQYPRLLEKAGLAEYIEKYPAFDPRPVATGAQFMQLLTIFRDSLEPALYELLQKNMGREFARAVTSGPVIQKEVQKLGSLAELENFQQAVDIIVRFNNATIDQKAYAGTPDDALVRRALAECPKGGAVIIYKNCLYCAHHDTTEKMACLTVATYLKEVFNIMTTFNNSSNFRVQTEEIYCAAQENSTDCYFLIKRV